MSSVNLKLVIAMARTYNEMFSKLESNIHEFDLSTSEFGVLEILLHKGEQPIQKIAKNILVTSGTITYVIDKLQKKNLVVRKKCEKDKRIFHISLTKKGEEFISDVFPKHKKFLDELLSGLENDLKVELTNNLNAVEHALK